MHFECPPQDNECRHVLTAQVDVPEGTALGDRVVSVKLSSGTIERIVDTKWALRVEKQRLIVLAIDGLGWESFDLLRNGDGVFGKWFGEAGSAQNVVATQQATFTPITFGRWATVFSGATPSEHGVPSNHFLNRRFFQPGGEAEYGALNQCIGCSGAAHMAMTAVPSNKPFNFHFRPSFVYDDLKTQKNGRSVVILQQAGLGKNQGTACTNQVLLNTCESPNGTWVKGPGPKASTFITGAGKVAAIFGDTSANADAQAFKQAKKHLNRDFDLMTIYLAGLDNRLHNGAAGETTAVTTQYVEQSIGTKLEAFRRLLRQTLRTEPAFAVFADHGHIPVAQGARRGFDHEPLQRALMPQVPSEPAYIASNVFDERANVLFQPEGGIAHIYVAGDLSKADAEKWRSAPTEARLKPIVDRLVEAFGATRGDGNRPFAQILVRLGGFSEPYRFVSESYNSSGSLLGQLRDLADLDTGDNQGLYLDPAGRIASWASENTGDIVLLANMDGGFYLDGGDLTSTHGSLSARDGLVPLAFAYPGATSKIEGEDTLLAKVRAFLQAGSGGSSTAFITPKEANSARCFLGLIPCQ